MRTLHVVSGILGGAGRVVHELARALRSDVTSDALLLSTARPDPAMVTMLREACEDVAEVTKLAKIDPIAVARVAVSLRRRDPDVVLLHDFTAYVWATLAAAGHRAPLVAVEHSNALGTPLRRIVRRTLHPRFAATVCVSAALEDHLRSMKVTSGVRTIENGIDQSALAPLAAIPRLATGPLRLVMIGRLDAPKDHATLFRALCLLRDRGVLVTLRVIGDGSLAAALAAQVQASALSAQVRFEGAQLDLLRHLADSDVVVLASRAEGLPIALIEGMAAGCVALASDVGAIGALLDRGAAGVLVPSGDPLALADAIAGLHEDRDRARALAAAGARRVAERYSARRMADEYRALFATLTPAP